MERFDQPACCPPDLFDRSPPRSNYTTYHPSRNLFMPPELSTTSRQVTAKPLAASVSYSSSLIHSLHSSPMSAYVKIGQFSLNVTPSTVYVTPFELSVAVVYLPFPTCVSDVLVTFTNLQQMRVTWISYPRRDRPRLRGSRSPPSDKQYRNPHSSHPSPFLGPRPNGT